MTEVLVVKFRICFLSHLTSLIFLRVEQLTQKRGKKLSSILKLFKVEKDKLVASGTAVTRTTGQVCANGCGLCQYRN